MKIYSKLTLLLFILAIAGIAYFGFPVIKERYLSQESQELEEQRNQKEEASLTINEGADAQSEETTDEDEEDETTPENDETANDTFVEIVPSDCDNNCSNFSDSEDINYCKQVCGLNTPQNPSAQGKDCAGLEDLEKDYCFKDLAVEKTDSKFCEQIDDKNIRTTCTNRIMEDIIDKQMENRNAEPI